MQVSIEQLRPDLVLGADLSDASGRLLLPTGTVLTEKHIRYCQMWGIAAVDIQVDDPTAVTAEQPIDPEAWAAAEAAVAPRFVHVDREHPAIAALFAHCVAAAIGQNRV